MDIALQLTIAILTFTVGGFALGCFNTGRNVWKGVKNPAPRNISDADAQAVADHLKTLLKDYINSDVHKILKEKYNFEPVANLKSIGDINDTSSD